VKPLQGSILNREATAEIERGAAIDDTDSRQNGCNVGKLGRARDGARRVASYRRSGRGKTTNGSSGETVQAAKKRRARLAEEATTTRETNQKTPVVGLVEILPPLGPHC
jgi:hypothetical protein